ncbi:MAG TPA: cytochrome c maturation protein CcmE [Anaerolineales bacterium]|nr:cytochrome c maturation protein CcmE [Anaerolineales bacterium]
MNKFIIGFFVIISAVIGLIVVNTVNTGQYFQTVDELLSNPNMQGRNVRLSGAVLGDTVTYNTDTLELRFEVVHIPGDQKDIDAQGGLATVLYKATTNPNAQRLKVVYVGEKPDLLRNEAQAIMDGRIGTDGVFYADTLLLKCPTRYEDQVPQQSGQ